MSTPEDLIHWTLAAELEHRLILLEAADGDNVAFAARPLTKEEKQAGTKFGAIDALITSLTEEQEPIITALYAAAVAGVLAEVFGEEGEELEVAAAAAIIAYLFAAKPRRYTREQEDAQTKVKDILVRSHTAGVLTVLDEARHQGKSIRGWVEPDPPEGLEDLGRTVTGHPIQRVLERAQTELTSPGRVLEGTITRGELEDFLEDTSQKGTVDIAHQAAQTTFGNGRTLTAQNYAGDFLLAIATEVLDRNTCGPCRNIDGTKFLTLEEAEEAYPAGRYSRCDGGARCRGFLTFLYDAPE